MKAAQNTVRVAVVISVLLIIAAMVYCLLKRHVRRMTRLEDEDFSAEHSEGGSWQADRDRLLLPHSDIACFPDGSPRFPTKFLQQDMEGIQTGDQHSEEEISGHTKVIV